MTFSSFDSLYILALLMALSGKKNANCGLETTIIISRPAKVFEYSFTVVRGKNIIFFKLQKLPYGNTKISRGLENYKKILYRITHFILCEEKGKI